MLNAGAANSELPNSAVRDWRTYAQLAATIATLEDTFDFRLYAATREFVTQSADSPVLTPFRGTLLKTISLSQSIAQSDSFGFGRISVTWGAIELINVEGDYDDQVDTATPAGRTITLKAGQLTPDRHVPPYAEFETVATLVAEIWSASRQSLRVTVRDNMLLLEVPAQPAIYGGTGNLDGTADMAGKRKPWPFGSVTNLTPAPEIPNELVYRVSWRGVQGIDAVYDGGFGLTFAANYATSVLLRQAGNAPAPGFYSTCVAEGLFRLGASPDKEVTCDVRGDNAGPGGYVTKTADIVRTIVSVAGGIDWTTGFDVAAFAHIDQIQSATIAYYLQLGDERTIADVVSALMGAIGGWAAFDRLGIFYVDRFDVAGIAPVDSYNRTHMAEFDRDDSIGNIMPPPKRFRCAYNRNWTVQTDLHGVVGVTNPARVAYLAQPFQVAGTSEAEAAAVENDFPNAPDPAVIESFFANQADAQAEADRLFALYNGMRAVYRFKIKDRVFVHRPGQTVFVSYPRFNLDNGKFARVVQVSDDPDSNETELVVHG